MKMSKTEFSNSIPERILEAILFPLIALLPYLLFRETIDSTVRNFAYKHLLKYALTMAIMTAISLPYIIEGLKNPGRPKVHVVAATISAFAYIFIIGIYIASVAARASYGEDVFDIQNDYKLILLIVSAALALAIPQVISGSRDPKRPMERMLVLYISTSLAFSTYFVVFRSFESFRLPQQTLMQITVSLIFVMFLFSSFLKGRIELRRMPLNTPILFVTLISLFSFFLSPNFFVSLKDFAQLFFVIMNFYLIVNTFDAKKHFNTLVAVFLIVMFIEGAIGMAQHFGVNKFIGLGNNRDPFSTLGNKNYVAEMLAMSVPLALGFSLAARRWWVKLLCWLAIVPMLFVVLLSVTRGSWIGLLAACIVFFMYSIDGLSKKKAVEAAIHLAGLIGISIVIMILSSNRIIFYPPDYSYASRFMSILNTVGNAIAKSPKLIVVYFAGFAVMTGAAYLLMRRKVAKLIGVGLVLAVMIVVSAIVLPSRGRNQAQQTAQTASEQIAPHEKIEDSVVSRSFIWGGTKEMIRHYKLGVGIGAYKIRYLSMLKAYLEDSNQKIIPGFFKDVNAKEAHNEYLHIWAELGPLGPLALIFFIVMLIRYFYRIYYTKPAQEDSEGDEDYTKSILLGAFSGLVSIGASAFFGFPFHIIGTSMFCGVLVALLALSEDRLLGQSTLGGNLPGFKTIWASATINIDKANSAAEALKQKAAKQQKKKGRSDNVDETPKPETQHPETPWTKRWIVFNFPPVEDGILGAFVGGLFIFAALVFCFITSVWSYDVQMANIVMKEANNIAQAGNSEEALKRYDLSLKLDPYNGDIHLYRGMFFQKIKDNEKSLAEFGEADRYFDLPQITLNRGALYFEMAEEFAKNGDPAKANEYYDKATDQFNESLAVYPSYELPRYNLGLIYYQKGVGLLNSKGSVMKSSDGQYELRGGVKAENALEYFRKAADMFTEAIKIKPELDTASFKLALTYEKLKKYDEALYWYQYTTKVNPNNYDAIYNEALVLNKKAAMYNALGKDAEKQGRKMESMQLFASAATMQGMSTELFKKAAQPNNAKALNNLGNTFFQQGKIQQALDMYKKALETDPNYPLALLNISLAHIQLKQYQESLQYLARLTQQPLDPQYEIKTYYMYGSAYAGLGRNNEAEAVLSSAVAKYQGTQYSGVPEFVSLILRYSQVLDTLGRMGDAEKYVRAALGSPAIQDYQEAEALYRLGYIQGKQNNLAEARVTFQQLVNKYPQSQFSAEARKNLAKISQLGR